MLRITPQLNADAAKRYQAQHLSKGDYYLSESENYGRWQGQGAEMLGLKEGSVISKKDYDRLCENKRPDDGSSQASPLIGLSARNRARRLRVHLAHSRRFHSAKPMLDQGQSLAL
jgi:hypothetical protein